ncbi:outer membrane beta-barrel protein [Boseaceae bacterium BT-24-1]|nr:outer membrane beta-barrel protein [Boseaceae bacterium BT-24-1]
MLALPQAALGADYLRGSQIEQPIEPPPTFGGGRFDWSGFYLGGGAGVSETKFKPGEGLRTIANYAFRNTDLAAERDMGTYISNLPDKRDSGSQFFGIVGYNYLFDDVTLGIEADYTRSGHEYSVSDFIARRSALSNGNVYDWSMATNQAAKLDDYATLRLRMGWAYGRIMPFGTIGAALGRFNTNSTINANLLIVNNAGAFNETRNQAVGYPLQVGAVRKNTYAFGLAAGAGVDWALTDNLFLRAEYQIVRFAEIEGTTTTVNTGRVAAALKF